MILQIIGGLIIFIVGVGTFVSLASKSLDLPLFFAFPISLLMIGGAFVSLIQAINFAITGSLLWLP